jgi:hypothetical protein
LLGGIFGRDCADDVGGGKKTLKRGFSAAILLTLAFGKVLYSFL